MPCEWGPSRPGREFLPDGTVLSQDKRDQTEELAINLLPSETGE